MAIVVCPIRFHDFKVPMKRNVLLSGTSLQRRTFADFSQVRWTYCFEIHWNFSFVAPFLEHFHSPLSCFNFLMFFAWAFFSISSSCSLFKSEFWLEKKLVFHSPTLQELQNEQAQIRASFGIEMVSSGILRFSSGKRICLTSLQPIRIKAANAFAALAFLVWPATRRVFQKAVCHLGARIDLI